MKKTLRRLLQAAAALALAAAFLPRAHSTTIEGYTAQGQFQTVLVTNPGRLQVDTSTGIPQHVITDTSSVVNATIVNTPLPVSGSLTTTVSTAATITTGQVTSIVTQVQIFAANSSRAQSNICNDDAVVNAWIGPTGVTTANGYKLVPGRCIGPDVPASFTGALYVISTGTASTGNISFFYITP